VAVATENELKGTKATAKWVRVSARKARLVLDGIRGRTVPEARTVLAFSERAVARDIELVLRSAVANVESANEARVSGDDLVVLRAWADEGPTLKRWQQRARGRVNRIHKRTCHITIELAPTADAVIAAPSAPARKPAAKPKATPAAESTEETPKPTRTARPKRAEKKTATPADTKTTHTSTRPRRKEAGS
jgi:large subunit ribosomal protein L22